MLENGVKRLHSLMGFLIGVFVEANSKIDLKYGSQLFE
jgi:hypothetical protein